MQDESMNGINAAAQIAVNTQAEIKKHLVVTPDDVLGAMVSYGYDEPTSAIIRQENLLPTGLLSRLHASYPQHSGLLEIRPTRNAIPGSPASVTLSPSCTKWDKYW